MHFILRLQQMHVVFFYYYFFYETEGTCDCIYVFSDFISFGPKLQVYNIIYMALYSL